MPNQFSKKTAEPIGDFIDKLFDDLGISEVDLSRTQGFRVYLETTDGSNFNVKVNPNGPGQSYTFSNIVPLSDEDRSQREQERKAKEEEAAARDEARKADRDALRARKDSPVERMTTQGSTEAPTSATKKSTAPSKQSDLGPYANEKK